ncbi:hypothetical protein PO909_023539 [Leuciscus waleckii]
MVEERRSDYIRGREALFTSSGVSMNVNQCGNRGPHNDNGQNISTPANDWVNGFQPREKTEAVRNCSALPRDFVDAVVLRVAKALLSLTARDIESSDCVDAWNTGGKNISNVSLGCLETWVALKPGEKLQEYIPKKSCTFWCMCNLLYASCHIFLNCFFPLTVLIKINIKYVL